MLEDCASMDGIRDRCTHTRSVVRRAFAGLLKAQKVPTFDVDGSEDRRGSATVVVRTSWIKDQLVPVEPADVLESFLHVEELSYVVVDGGLETGLTVGDGDANRHSEGCPDTRPTQGAADKSQNVGRVISTERFGIASSSCHGLRVRVDNGKEKVSPLWNRPDVGRAGEECIDLSDFEMPVFIKL